MKLFLKQNWSEQFIYGDKTPGVFVGRKQEIKSLKNIVVNNDSSAILVSSVRGVGKTSFVHKALSEIIKVHPIFVNIGHTLSYEKIETDKKLILKSLIRAIRFNKDFRNDKDLKKIYEKSLGNYSSEKEQIDQTTSTKNVGIGAEIKLNTKTTASIFAVFLSVLGFSLDVFWIRIIVGTLGVGMLLLTLSWKKSWTNSLINKERVVIDDSTEYLEIEFENWLKQQNKKIVFVIDELDKIKLSDGKEVFDIIKEYKNLFTRSFAHFIFITDQRAFELVNEDREDEEKGIFPTFFTHIFYLSLPSADELRVYLDKILKSDSNINKAEKNEIIDYLLFRSGNDFFTLKRLLSDVVIFNDDDEPFIDIEKIKDSDEHFSKTAKLFVYIEKWFLGKYQHKLKKFWKDNSELQKEIFKFLNDKFNPPTNFSYKKDIKEKNELKNLPAFLVDIGVVEEKTATAESELEEGDFEYIWTHKYKRKDVNAPLVEDDKKFQRSFCNLIKLANNLDDLPKNYKTGEFEDYDFVSDGNDGSDVSGISLYSTYSDYKNIYQKLKSASKRVTVTTSKVKEAKIIIDEQVQNIFSKYFEILTNLLSTHILKDKPNFFIGQQLNQRPQIFSSCPSFQEVFTPIPHMIYGKEDNTRSVLLVKDFTDFTSINNGLKSLMEQKNILVININKTEEYKKEAVRIQIDYKDSIGRNRKKKVKVDNFINYSFADFRQFSDILSMIENHLGE